MDSTATIQKIVSTSGKSGEEIRKLVEEKKQRFAGLLTESGAALMVAKELGVVLGLERQELERLSISELKEGMNNIELLAKIKHIFPVQEFEKNGRTGKLCRLVVSDASGEIRLTVWNREAERIQVEKVERCSAILLRNCFVSRYRENLELSLPYNGKMELNHAGKSGMQGESEKVVGLTELGKNESDVSVLGRILRMFPEKEFEKNGRKGRLLNFLLGNGKAVVRATAWDSAIDEVKRAQPGDAVKIEGAYTKEGLQGIELQLGFRARIIREPESARKLPPAVEMRQEQKAIEKKVGELQEGSGMVQLNAEIVDVLPGNLRFNVCPKCGKKAEAAEGGYLCEQCGEVQPGIRAVVSLRIKDETGEIDAVLFAEQAEKAIGLKKEELKKRLEVNTAEQLIAEIREKIVGKEVQAKGFAKMNSYSQKLEFNAREFGFE